MGKQKTVKRKSTSTNKAEAESQPKSAGNVYDAFVKRMFSRIFVFVDFLLHYADPVFVDAVDLASIRPAPTHYIGKDGAERIVDLVFQCPLKNGNGNLMAVIIFEHQGKSLKKGLTYLVTKGRYLSKLVVWGIFRRRFFGLDGFRLNP